MHTSGVAARLSCHTRRDAVNISNPAVPYDAAPTTIVSTEEKKLLDPKVHTSGPADQQPDLRPKSDDVRIDMFELTFGMN